MQLPIEALIPMNGDLRETVERLVDVVDGNDKKDIKGLRPRVRELEDMAKKWRDLSMMGKGLAVGLALNLLGTLAALIVLARLFAEISVAHPGAIP